jgi:NADH-quinone oxidoreductase subunit N
VDISYEVLLPELILAATGLVVMLLTPVTARGRNSILFWISLVGVLMAMSAIGLQWGQKGDGFFGMVFQDGFAHLSKLLFLLATGSVIAVADHYLTRERLQHGEFYALLLFATTGMCLMVASADLIMTFLGIEILSIASYILVGFRDADRPAESSWKYFILGAFSTAFLLYGVALIYGSTGSTRYLEIAGAISRGEASPVLLSLGTGLLLVGFGFKAALVPFHVWTPDVYEGAPVPITSYLAVASKAAAFLALLRILQQVLPELDSQWRALLWISAVLTMLLGNIAALSQNNIKRMLAYSSIAHAGYLLVGLTANNGAGSEAVVFYLVSYAFMTLGAFAIVQILADREERFVNLSDYSGLGKRSPFLSVSLALFMFSMAGIPATAGFMGKLFLFSSAIKSGLYFLVVLGLAATAIGVYYYIRVVVLMFMREPGSEPRTVKIPASAHVVVVIMILGTLILGLLPGSLLEMIREANFF